MVTIGSWKTKNGEQLSPQQTANQEGNLRHLGRWSGDGHRGRATTQFGADVCGRHRKTEAAGSVESEAYRQAYLSPERLTV